MRTLTVLSLVLFLLPGWDVFSAERGGAAPAMRPSFAGQPRPMASSRPQPMAVRQPVVINMNRGTSGGHNHNFPSQQPQASQPANHPPSYGQLHWNNPSPASPQAPVAAPEPAREGFISSPVSPRPSAQGYSQPGVKAAVAVHHHAYTQGYVRQKLQKLGVTSEPSLITDRSEIIETDRAHSTIRFPEKGPDHQPLKATVVSPRHFNDEVVRDRMALVDSPEWQTMAGQYNASENKPGHYYWHNYENVDFCHYLDASGYNWYGWYEGSQCFWTRNFNGRWWWYDSDFNRWCFWNNGYWWWQDPYHVGDLYCYNDDNYIPCNSAEDQIVVTAPDGGSQQVFTSPDGTRQVKLTPDSQDAFLYDTANPPSFDPIYLASGVQSVQFSDPGNGRPLEVVLKLNDGSFDLFDNQGNPYGPGAFDADQAAANGDQPQADASGPSNAQVLQQMNSTLNSPSSTNMTEP